MLEVDSTVYSLFRMRRINYAQSALFCLHLVFTGCMICTRWLSCRLCSYCLQCETSSPPLRLTQTNKMYFEQPWDVARIREAKDVCRPTEEPKHPHFVSYLCTILMSDRRQGFCAAGRGVSGAHPSAQSMVPSKCLELRRWPNRRAI